MAFSTRQGTGFNLRHALRQWVSGWLSGEPHFIIGQRYLLRWYVIPRNPWLNIYLHKFLHDDEDRATHDHPWNFVSIMLWGGYLEFVGKLRESPLYERRVLSIAYRPAEHAHRVILHRRYGDGAIQPAWTIMITGPVIRDWGFWCPKERWVHWKVFTAFNEGKGDYGQTGRGCD